MSKLDSRGGRRQLPANKSPLLIKSKKISKRFRARASNRRPLAVQDSSNNNENVDFNILKTEKVAMGFHLCQRMRLEHPASQSGRSPDSEGDPFRSFDADILTKTDEVIEDIISLASKDSSLSSDISYQSPLSKIEVELNLDFYIKLSDDYKIALLKPYPQHITRKMRAILVDWMMEVCKDLKFMRETFYCAVDYLDRTIIKTEGQGISKENLQLYGLTCLLIAAKKEEKLIPSIETFELLTEKTFLAKDIQKCEKSVLQTLAWLLTPVTINYWINFLSEAWKQHLLQYPSGSKPLEKTLAFAAGLLDFSAIDVDSLQFTPVKLCLAAFLIAVEAKMNWAVCEFSMFCRKFALSGFLCLEAEKQFLQGFLRALENGFLLDSEAELQQITNSFSRQLQNHSKTYLSRLFNN